MYESFFGFRQRPFSSVPQPNLYYPSDTMENARQCAARCAQRGEGTAVVLGPSGSGKSLLCQLIAEQFRPSMRVALLACGGLTTRRALLQAILYALARPYRGMDEGELRLALIDYLSLDAGCAEGVLLLVDEAHTLPLRLLDELRLLTNLARGSQPQVRLVLTGSCALEEKLAHPRLDSFNQRIVARCYLESLTRSETAEYIRTLADKAGGSGKKLFGNEACDAAFSASDGIPRLVSQLCDHALLLAYVMGERAVSVDRVQEAWSDLQQLPTPWNVVTRRAGPCTSSAIEFGSLSEETTTATADAAARQTHIDELGSLPEELHQDAAETSPLTEAFSASEQTSDADSDELPDGQICDQPAESASVYVDDLEDSLDEDADAEEHVRQIEHLLAEVDGSFRPAGRIGPEVELVFDDCGDPLAERFLEEEVVEDRYAAPPTRVAPPAPGHLATAAVAAEHRSEASDGCQTTSAAAEFDCEPKTVPLPARPQAIEAEPAESLVIEESRAQAAVCRVAAVRRQEFRQLFARLRRERAG